MANPDNQAKPLHHIIHYPADASKPVVPYLWRKPRTSRRNTKPQTEAQKRASAINFALFRLKSAQATTGIVPGVIQDSYDITKLGDDLAFELREAFTMVRVADLHLRDAIRAINEYNAQLKMLSDKRTNKQGEL